jgi:hypothetical protein
MAHFWPALRIDRIKDEGLVTPGAKWTSKLSETWKNGLANKAKNKTKKSSPSEDSNLRPPLAR